jgi:CheY-like chemotaxis protein
LADNGKVAVSKISEGTHFDVILMDCQMPEMDGFDATKEIRRIEIAKGKHTPIIAMTANAFRETKERCFASGMDNFITKPIKLETLIELINNTLLKLKSA